MRVFQYQDLAEPLSEAPERTTPDKWQGSRPDLPNRNPALAGAILAGSLFFVAPFVAAPVTPTQTAVTTPDFLRVRFGIGRPAPGGDGASYVLADFSRAEQKQLPDLRMLAADAVEEIIASGLVAAMNRFNTKNKDGKSDSKSIEKKTTEKKPARSGDAS